MHDDTTDTLILARYVPDLAKDNVHRWISKHHYLPIVILSALLVVLGGWPFLLWGIFLRTVVGLHATWLVNSATHIWGSRRFATRDDSTNNWFIAFLTFGEGWHNNHHAHPTSARHGMKWYEIDMNWYGIWALRGFGLATQIKRVRAGDVVRKEVLPEESVIQNTRQNLQSTRCCANHQNVPL